jgi:hypothetical protein
MKRIVKSRLDEHMVDLYHRVDNLKKDISVIKNNHLKHLHEDVMGIHQKLDKYVNSFIGFLIAVILLLAGAILKHFFS